MKSIANARVGAELLEHRDIGRWGYRAHSPSRIGLRRMRAGIAQSPKADDLRSDERHVAIHKLGWSVDKCPAAIAGSQVAQPQSTVAQLEPSVQRGHVHVFGESDISVSAADDCFTPVQREQLGHVSRVVEQSEPWPGVAGRAERLS